MSDCEARDTWFLEQDVNAVTSLAYCAVGVVVVIVVVRRHLPLAFIAFGAVLAFEGIGSVMYHGGSGDVAQFLHDGPLVGALGFIAGWHVGRLGDHRAEIGRARRSRVRAGRRHRRVGAEGRRASRWRSLSESSAGPSCWRAGRAWPRCGICR